MRSTPNKGFILRIGDTLFRISGSACAEGRLEAGGDVDHGSGGLGSRASTATGLLGSTQITSLLTRYCCFYTATARGSSLLSAATCYCLLLLLWDLLGQEQ